MAKTTPDEMNDLHAQLAKVLKTSIEDATQAEEKKGLAALLNVARQFLKDNDVTALAVPESPLKSLADSLPFAGDEFVGGDDSPIH